MGPLGTQELVFIFLLALLMFGPKKLPELGRTIGKAMTEFRRAQSELKSTFDREMKNLERETDFTKELTATNYQADSYNYDYSSYDSMYHSESNEVTYDSTATNPSINGASAIEGAGSTVPQIAAAAGTIASGHMEHDYGSPDAGYDYSGNHYDSVPETAVTGTEHSQTTHVEPAEKTSNS